MPTPSTMPFTSIAVGAFTVKDYGEGVISSSVAGWIGEPHLEHAASGAQLAVDAVASKYRQHRQTKAAAAQTRTSAKEKLFVAIWQRYRVTNGMRNGWRQDIASEIGATVQTVSAYAERHMPLHLRRRSGGKRQR